MRFGVDTRQVSSGYDHRDYGCFHNSGVLLVDVLLIRPLLFGFQQNSPRFSGRVLRGSSLGIASSM